jgi:hypothetical protein
MPQPEPQMLGWDAWVDKAFSPYISVDASAIEEGLRAVRLLKGTPDAKAQASLQFPAIAEFAGDPEFWKEDQRQQNLTNLLKWMPEIRKLVSQMSTAEPEARAQAITDVLTDPNYGFEGMEPDDIERMIGLIDPMTAKDMETIKQKDADRAARVEHWQALDNLKKQAATDLKAYRDASLAIARARAATYAKQVEKAKADTAGGMTANQARLFADQVNDLQRRNNDLRATFKKPLDKDRGETAEMRKATDAASKAEMTDNSNQIRFLNGLLDKAGYPIPGQGPSTPGGGSAPAPSAPTSGTGAKTAGSAANNTLYALIQKYPQYNLQAAIADGRKQGLTDEQILTKLRQKGY